MPTTRTAADWLDLVLDPGSFASWDEPVSTVDSPYAGELARAAERAGADEAVRTGEGRVAGHRVAVLVSEFGFLGGSIGVATGRRLVAAIRRATAQRLPVLAAPASGGTRMQEGTPAFVGMVDIVRAVVAHRRAGLPYLVFLRHPTTGGVLASWASLGQVTVAEPGALVGFLGPRVHEVLTGHPFPGGVQVAEHLVERGVLDAVIPPEELRAGVARMLDLVVEREKPGGPPPRDEPVPAGPAWDSVTRSRRPDRPGVRELLRAAGGEVVRLRGTGDGGRDDALVLGVARLDGLSCVLLGQDRAAQAAGPGLGPAALRQAQRGIRLADELGLPLVTVIDTPGAPLTVEGEEHGLASEIARTIAALTELAAPSVSVLLGPGAGGAALALLPARRVLAARHAWLAPLPPEGASAITHRDTAHAAEVAERQRVAAPALHATGVAHRLIPEHPDAADEPDAFCARVLAYLGAELRAQLR